MPLITRLATPADLPAAARLFDQYRQFYAQAPDLPRALAFLAERQTNGQSVLLLAEDHPAGPGPGPLLGLCQLYPSFCSVEAQPIAVLYDLFVDPAARRAGVGRALLQAAEAWGRQTGLARLDLSTARSNTAAQALYASLGWVRDEVFLTYNRWLDGAASSTSKDPSP